MGAPRILVLDRSDDLAEQIRSAYATADPAPEVVTCNRIGAVPDLLAQDGPYDVLVAGPSLGTRAGLARLRVIREEVPGTSLVLAFSRRPDAGLREIVRTGAIELLQLPVPDADLAEELDRAIELSQLATPVAAVAELAPPAVSMNGARRPGRVFTIASATGGCGKTFYATNLAYFLARWTGQRVCIVDLDLQFGEISTALRLRPRYTIFDALQRADTDETDLRVHLEDYMVVHDTGVHVLAAPRDPAEADRITPPDVTRVLEAARGAFDHVVVDTPPALAETVLAAFDLSDALYVLATLDLPSVRNMSVFLGTLERLKVPSENVRLVLNKAETDVGIEVGQVTRLFPQGFESTIPYAKEVSRSINLGMPVMASSPQSEISVLLAGGMRNLVPEETRAEVDASFSRPRGGLLRRLRR